MNEKKIREIVQAAINDPLYGVKATMVEWWAEKATQRSQPPLTPAERVESFRRRLFFAELPEEPGSVIRVRTPGAVHEESGLTAIRSWVKGSNEWWAHGGRGAMTSDELYEKFSHGYVVLKVEPGSWRPPHP